MNDENDKNNDDWGMTMPHMRYEEKKNAEDFSDDYAKPKSSVNQPSNDDWGATQQNFNLPNDFRSSASDFDKTTPNVNIPKDVWNEVNQPPPSTSSNSPASLTDDWGMTQQNFSLPHEQKPDEWGATTPNINIPQSNNADEWGMTQANVNFSKPEQKRDEWSMPAPIFRISEGEKVDNFPKRTPGFNQSGDEETGFDKTMPNFNLSDVSAGRASNAAYALTQPSSEPVITPNAVVNDASAPTKNSGSKLIYVLGGIIVLLFFGVVSLAGFYFFYLNKPQTTALTETPKEQSLETAPTAVPLTAPVTNDTALPKEIVYKTQMVLVPAGEFTMGSDTDAEESKPAHSVTLPAFYIDKTEVTNAEYKKFCDETGKSYPPDPHLEKGYFTNRPNAPVVGVSFADAKAFATWSGKRLPTEAEWEKAASWDETIKAKRAFPWGNEFQKSNVAFGLTAISDVGKFADGASSFGALDMAGNVLEWVDAYFQPYPNSPSNNAEFGEKNRIVRGGHFGSKTNDSLKTTKRIYVSPDIASGEDDEKLVAAIIGFRCAVSADDSGVQSVLSMQGK